MRMSSDVADAESKVSGNQANIPARIRRELDIEDGDHLRWFLDDSGELRVEVVSRESGTFAEFEGYDGNVDTDAADDHDEWGLE
jgi:bifunctional DNA-binding transcriptional regulator/antitoxin component of YhaV-PrlF toxin-antitoxin module